MKAVRAVGLALLGCGAAYGQTFEVAAVKLSLPLKPGEPPGRMGCFGGRDPARYTCARASVSQMAVYAYDLQPYQVRPLLSTDTRQFNLEAKAPPGTTAEQIRVMLRNLLSERFKLAFHREKAEVRGYALVVAKGGVKMKESASDAASSNSPAASGPIHDREGFVYIPPSRNALAVSRANGLTRWVGNNVPLNPESRGVGLTRLLYTLTGLPVVDATGLTGKYDFTLTFTSDSVGEGLASAPSSEGAGGDSGQLGRTLFGAVEDQLGLKLEAKKIGVELFVIDHAEKVPAEN